jgi:hypothetical protein
MEPPKLPIKFPFDYYDFFGYFFPGIAMVMYGYVFVHTVYGETVPSVIASFGVSDMEKAPLLIDLALFVVGVVFVYVVGHVVATFSNLYFDKILMKEVLGYPFLRLLGMASRPRPFSRPTYAYCVVLFNLLLIWVAFSPAAIRHDRVAWILFYGLMALLGLRIIAKFITDVLSNCKWFKRLRDSRRLAFIWGAPVRYVIDPIIRLIESILGVDESFPDDFTSRYRSAFQGTYEIDPDKAFSENYWLSYYGAAKHSQFSEVVRTWLHLYGFSRNLACASYLAATSMSIWCLFIAADGEITSAVRLQLWISILLGCVFTLRYWVLYYTYYSKNVFRTFLVSCPRDIFTKSFDLLQD